MSANDTLFEAIKSGDLAGVRAALDAEPALASARNAGGVSAILLATYYGRSDIAQELLARGIPLDICEAAAVGDEMRVARLLAQDPSTANDVSADGFPALGLAVFFGCHAIAERLLAAGADVNAQATNAMRVRPLHSAIANRDAATALRLTQLLLRHNANVNVAQQGGWTPLHEAADQNYLEVARLLLDVEADRHAHTDDGRTPRDMALARGYAEMAALLEG